jgi:hypothetical protein
MIAKATLRCEQQQPDRRERLPLSGSHLRMVFHGRTRMNPAYESDEKRVGYQRWVG